MAYPSRPLRKTSFSQQESQGNDLNTATLDAELNQLVACFDQLASRLESITTPAGLLKNVAAATAMALNGVQVFTATASQTIFTTTIPWDTSFSSLTVTVVSQGLKLNPSLVTVADSSGVLRVTVPAQTAGNIVQVLAYSAGAGVLTRLASLSAGDGATLVAVRDLGGYWTSAEVEGALQEVGARIVTLEAGDPTRWRKDGANGPATGNWDLGNHQIKGLAPGTLSTDAVNLAQLSVITNEVSSLLRGACTVFGFTMQGGINMDGNAIENLPAPVQDGDAANKKYVDDTVAGASPDLSGYFKRDGTAPPTADTPWNNKKITGLAAGSAADEAVRVDQTITRDGLNYPLADTNWGGKKITNLAPGTLADDAVRIDQLPSLANYLRRDGTNSPSSDISWNGKKIENLANGAAAQDAATVAQAMEHLLGEITYRWTSPSTVTNSGNFVAGTALGIDAVSSYSQFIKANVAAAAAMLIAHIEVTSMSPSSDTVVGFRATRKRGAGYTARGLMDVSGVYYSPMALGVVTVICLLTDVQVNDEFGVSITPGTGSVTQHQGTLLLRSNNYI